jgi:hypothetical protein
MRGVTVLIAMALSGMAMAAETEQAAPQQADQHNADASTGTRYWAFCPEDDSHFPVQRPVVRICYDGDAKVERLREERKLR